MAHPAAAADRDKGQTAGPSNDPTGTECFTANWKIMMRLLIIIIIEPGQQSEYSEGALSSRSND